MRTSLTPFTGFPAVSWSLVDADYRKKLAWYAVKRAYAPITIGAERFVEEKLKPGANKHTAIDISKTTGLRVWTSNLTLQPVEAVLHLRMFKVGGEESVYESKTKIILEPNRSQEVMKYLPMPVGGTQSSDEVHETVAAHTVVALLLRSLEGEVLARFVEWPQPLRHLDLLPDGVDVIVKAGKHDDQRIVTLSSSHVMPTSSSRIIASTLCQMRSERSLLKVAKTARYFISILVVLVIDGPHSPLQLCSSRHKLCGTG
jgi:beta-mannosidase